MSRNQVNPFSTLSTPSNNSTSLQLSSPYLTHPVPIPLYAGEPGALLATLSARHAFYTQRTRASQAVAGAQLRAAIDARRASAVAAAAAGPEGSGAQSSKRKRARQSTAATAAAPDNENVDEDENEECPVEKRLRTALEQTTTRAPAQHLPLSSTTTTPTAFHHQAFLAAAPAAPFQHPYPQANAAGMGSSSNYAAPSTGRTSQGPSSRSRTTAGRTSSRTGSNSNNRHAARAPLPRNNGFLLAGVLPPTFNTTTAAPLYAPPPAVVPQFTPLMAARTTPATATAAPPVLPSAPRAPLYVDLTTASDGDDGEERGYDNTGLGHVNSNAWAPANTTNAAAAVGAAVQTQAQLPAPLAAGPQKTAVDPQEVASMLQWRRQPPEWSQPSKTGFLNKEAYKKMTRTPWKPVKRGTAAAAAAAVPKRLVVEKTIRKETSRSRTTTNTRAASTVARPQGVVEKTAPAPVPAQTTKPSSGKSQAILEKEKALQNALEDLEREKEKEMAERRHQPNQLAAAETGAVNDSPTHATTTTAITRSAPQNPALLLDEGYGSNNTSPAKDPEHPETQELPESLRNCGLLLPGMRRGPPAPKPKEKQKAAEKEAEKKVEPQRADQDNSAELVGPDRTSEQPTPNPDEIEDGANDNQDNDLDELLEITTDDLDELFGDADGNNNQEKEAEHSDIAEADVIESRDRCQDFLEQLWPSRNFSDDLPHTTTTESENVEASDPSQSQEKDSSLFSLFGDSEDDEHDESDDESEQQEGQTRRELANAQVEQQRKKANDQRREAEDLERARETAARKLAKEQEKLRQEQLLQQQRDEEANDLLAMLEQEMMRDPEAEARAEQQRIEDEARAAQKRIEDEWSEEE